MRMPSSSTLVENGGTEPGKLPELLKDWVRLRKECLKLLKSVKGARWERMGTHETAGPLTMDALLRRHAMGNDEAHLAQIEGIKNISFPVLDHSGHAFAAVTVPFLRRLDQENDRGIEQTREALKKVALKLSATADTHGA